MSEQDELNPAERELEAALRSLTPATVRIDPVAAAFAAGERTARRQLRQWQSATAALVVISACAWFVPVQRGTIFGRHIEAPAPIADSVAVVQPHSEQSLLKLRQAIWEKGDDGLPAVELPLVTPLRANEMLSTQRGEI
ncbi:MAG TPA: hypothetical protein VGM76_02750 [Lacipirellulaceae bacterium]|jgi:hypothetical protein